MLLDYARLWDSYEIYGLSDELKNTMYNEALVVLITSIKSSLRFLNFHMLQKFKPSLMLVKIYLKSAQQ